MPYFRCERCALRLYGADSETQCPECDTPFARTERLLEAIPLAQPRHPRSVSWAQVRRVDQRIRG